MEHVIRAATSRGSSQGWNIMLFGALAIAIYIMLKSRICRAKFESFVIQTQRPWHWVFWPLAVGFTVFLQLRFLGPVAPVQLAKAGEHSTSLMGERKEPEAENQFHKLGNPSSFFTKDFNGITVSLPKSWKWMDHADAESLNTNTEAVGESVGMKIDQGNNTILVAGNAFNDAEDSVATVRLSARSAPTISQAELRLALNDPQTNIENVLVGQAEHTAMSMRKLPYVIYYNVIGAGLRQNGSLICTWSAFEFDIGKGPYVSDTWICPLSNRTLKLTTSYSKARANLFAATVDHIWRSLSL